MNNTLEGFWQKNKYTLAWLFIGSLALRVMFFMLFTRHGENAWIYFDSAQYHTIALQIAAGNGITNQNDGQPQTYRLPGYPLFLAACYKIFSHSILFTLLFQIIIASLLPLLIFIISNLLFPGKTSVALLTGIVAAVHPGFILYAGMLATEPLFTFFLCLFFIFFALGIQPHNKQAIVFFTLAGINLGIASLIRPVGHYVVLITIIIMLIALRPFLQTICCIGSLLLGWLCLVTPWLLRNYLLTGALFFHTLPGLHFLQYTAANIVVAHDGCSYVTARSRLLKRWETAITQQEKFGNLSLNDYERCKLAEHLAFAVIIQHPFLALKDTGTQIIKTCCSLYSAQVLIADTGQWPDYGPTTSVRQKIYRFLLPELKHRYLMIFIYWDIAILLLLLLGLVGYCAHSLYTQRIIFIELYTLILIALIIGLTLAYGCARLRFPAEPFIMPLACNFYIWLATLYDCPKIHVPKHHDDK